VRAHSQTNVVAPGRLAHAQQGNTETAGRANPSANPGGDQWEAEYATHTVPKGRMKMANIGKLTDG
jgi:hypothetical protein